MPEPHELVWLAKSKNEKTSMIGPAAMITISPGVACCDRGLRYDPVEAVRRRLQRSRRQHASGTAARVQGLARGTGGARGRCEGDRDDRAPRDRGRGCRPDPCPRGGAGSLRRHRRHAARAHQGSGATLVSRGHRKARRHHRRASMRTKIKRALVSVYDKTGLVELARGLHDLGVELVSSGNTATAVEAAGIPVTTVEAVTESPEML